MTTPATTEALDFVVRRDDVRVHACRPAARSRPHAGQVLLRIDRFGFTANNITFVTLGDRFSYWSFFLVTERARADTSAWVCHSQDPQGSGQSE